ncbi:MULTISPECIES: DUF3486 family protein [unclassified Pseudoalteromonas]|uniref:DUF3486 family protein n=1 Tax=unclassified Pseudoalteromonas TaxID=194690 RepID=UPI001F1B2CE8|nr:MULTISPECIES: DUF3486 family protein [unclassified Pseudoalteromonas]MCF2829824.1 DUF3486 family protein [Pseudoalteromonas sp. OF5H-5]MCF2834609.1 DUF3486 family protein [Pseudoalteromonas sp. DL2-H6]MCF2927792.1 DUF3486 family protein [Pseudoalteromonas sp. DL2-H1]
MSDAVRRGKPSKIDMLPEDIKKMLDEMLRDSGNSQADILDAINRRILDAGMDEEATISRSGLSRHAQKTEAIGKQLRETQAATKALVAELGDKPMGETSKLILEMGRTQLFKAMQRQLMNPDEDADIDIGEIKEVMRSTKWLEETAMKVHQREKDIRKAFAEEAAAAAEETAIQAGLTAEGAQMIKNQILGIA